MILIIDSENRTRTTDSTTNFEMNLIRPIEYTTAQLKEISLNVGAIYNITSSNATFSFTESGEAETTASVEVGRYNIEDLCQAVEDSLNTESPTSSIYSVAYSERTKKVTIVSTIDFTFHSYPSLGFTSDSSEATTAVSDSIPSLVQPQYYFMNISSIPNGSTNDSVNVNSFYFAIDSDDNSVVKLNVIDLNCQKIVLQDTHTLKQFYVSIKNKDNTILNLNGTNFYAVVDLN